ncbi:LolA family protein [Alkalicoccobacillus porphyridii]|uniref:Outer membrane lipoprotein carrier protein LolA n=1 Tax=Alkalicoccobacillus porphyridii TaxID=2597270 RepID=A0A554A172_9BACI|nr:hypothetical protein [Alkalicoccobacillus porphyridii]TSB47441.1 hypothetical protein FN960_06815 [Alkalicoccobacillus porphyridii]
MKKLLVCALTGLVFLSACVEEEQGEEEFGAANGEVEQNDSDQNELDADTPSPEDILNEAIAFYDDLTGLYIVVDGESDVELDGEQENVPEGSISMSTKETQWNFIEDGALFTRLELESFVDGEEEGEDFAAEQQTNIQFSDLDDPNYTITYDEGDDQAVRFETGASADQEDMTIWASEYQSLLEEAELAYVGEEEINGYLTYQIEATLDGEVTSYWFDQETYFEIKTEHSTVADTENAAGDTDSTIEVVEYEVNPEFDESLFQAPEGVEVVDGELEDTFEE